MPAVCDKMQHGLLHLNVAIVSDSLLLLTPLQRLRDGLVEVIGA